MPTVTLYTSPGCTDCTAAARAMDRKGVPFAPIDLASESAAVDYVRGLGHQRAPVTVIHDSDGAEVDHWAGYRPDKLMSLSNLLTS